jgi:hypothetical protein
MKSFTYSAPEVWGPRPERTKTTMNRQVNPDCCYEAEDGTMYMLVPVRDTREWDVTKNGRIYRTFTSLAAAKGWLEHVLEHPESDRPTPKVIVAGAGGAEFKAKLAAMLNGGRK